MTCKVKGCKSRVRSKPMCSFHEREPPRDKRGRFASTTTHIYTYTIQDLRMSVGGIKAYGSIEEMEQDGFSMSG